MVEPSYDYFSYENELFLRYFCKSENKNIFSVLSIALLESFARLKAMIRSHSNSSIFSIQLQERRETISNIFSSINIEGLCTNNQSIKEQVNNFTKIVRFIFTSETDLKELIRILHFYLNNKFYSEILDIGFRAFLLKLIGSDSNLSGEILNGTQPSDLSSMFYTLAEKFQIALNIFSSIDNQKFSFLPNKKGVFPYVYLIYDSCFKIGYTEEMYLFQTEVREQRVKTGFIVYINIERASLPGQLENREIINGIACELKEKQYFNEQVSNVFIRYLNKIGEDNSKRNGGITNYLKSTKIHCICCDSYRLFTCFSYLRCREQCRVCDTCRKGKKMCQKCNDLIPERIVSMIINNLSS